MPTTYRSGYLWRAGLGPTRRKSPPSRRHAALATSYPHRYSQPLTVKGTMQAHSPWNLLMSRSEHAFADRRADPLGVATIRQRTLRRWRLALLLMLVLLPQTLLAAELLVFAAASLKPALDEWLKQPATTAIADIKVSYAASSQLARQIDNGAPAALFISADTEWMDYLAERQRIVVASRGDLLGNALVLATRADSSIQLRIEPGFDLAGALGTDQRLAIAEPNSVPAGKYAKSSLTALGVWLAVKDRLVATDSVRAALNFVLRGETPLGIVYRSDVVSDPAVRIVDTFPESSHRPIRYPAALIVGHDSAAARQLLQRLRDADSASLFRRYGFDAPPR